MESADDRPGRDGFQAQGALGTRAFQWSVIALGHATTTESRCSRLPVRPKTSSGWLGWAGGPHCAGDVGPRPGLSPLSLALRSPETRRESSFHSTDGDTDILHPWSVRFDRTRTRFFKPGTRLIPADSAARICICIGSHRIILAGLVWAGLVPSPTPPSAARFIMQRATHDSKRATVLQATTPLPVYHPCPLSLVRRNLPALLLLLLLLGPAPSVSDPSSSPFPFGSVSPVRPSLQGIHPPSPPR